MDASLPMDASPKTLGKFLLLNLFVTHQRTGTSPAQFRYRCAGAVVFPMARVPAARACPHGSCPSRGCGSGIGCREQPGLWWLSDVKAEKDLFQGRKMSRGRKM